MAINGLFERKLYPVNLCGWQVTRPFHHLIASDRKAGKVQPTKVHTADRILTVLGSPTTVSSDVVKSLDPVMQSIRHV